MNFLHKLMVVIVTIFCLFVCLFVLFCFVLCWLFSVCVCVFCVVLCCVVLCGLVWFGLVWFGWLVGWFVCWFVCLFVFVCFFLCLFNVCLYVCVYVPFALICRVCSICVLSLSLGRPNLDQNWLVVFIVGTSRYSIYCCRSSIVYDDDPEHINISFGESFSRVGESIMFAKHLAKD